MLTLTIGSRVSGMRGSAFGAAPHQGGHKVVSGEASFDLSLYFKSSSQRLQMSNPISSPGDSIFYLHHTLLDKVWWDWKALGLAARL